MKKKMFVVLAIVLGFVILTMGMVMYVKTAVEVAVAINTETVREEVNKEWVELIQREKDAKRFARIEELKGLSTDGLLDMYVIATYGEGSYAVIRSSILDVTIFDVYYHGEMIQFNEGFDNTSRLIEAILAREGY